MHAPCHTKGMVVTLGDRVSLISVAVILPPASKQLSTA